MLTTSSLKGTPRASDAVASIEDILKRCADADRLYIVAELRIILDRLAPAPPPEV